MKRFAMVFVLVAMVVAFAPAASARPVFPERVPLPDGFYPEDIAIGRGHEFFVGSLLDGAVYKGDLRTGAGSVLTPGVDGRLVVGVDFDRRSGLLWGAGSDAGVATAFAFDGRTGSLVHRVEVHEGMFLNDLVVTREAVYITDSLADHLWRIPLDRRGRPAGPAEPVELTGDFELVTAGPLPINLNGIAATPDGKTLLAVHTALGVLYRIDPTTGVATEVDLGGGALPSGDGLVLHGRTLYVVQNFLNQLAVVRLSPDLASGEITDVIRSDLFRVPTTAERFGNSLYVVNARFDVAFPPALGGTPMSIDYDVVQITP